VREKRGKSDKTPLSSLDELHAFIAELPPVDTWNLDETVSRIRQLSHDERAVFLAALIHDWRTWRIAMVRFGDVPELHS